jgi:hypothetical protein
MNDEELGLLMGEHFRSKLDGRLGSAQGAFEEHIARRRAMVFRLMAAGSALAACLAVALIIVVSVRGKLPTPSHSNQIPESQPTPAIAFTPDVSMERLISCQNIDEGTVVLDDNTPARRVRRRMIERVILHDGDDQTTVELTTPREEVFYVPLNPY